MTGTALLAVAHGSRDHRAGRVLRELLAGVLAARPGLVAELGYLEHSEPNVRTVLDRLAAVGASRIVAVPLLLTTAYHARVDLPAVLAAFRVAHPAVGVTQSAALGPDPLLLAAVRRRMREAGAERCNTVVLGAIGTSHAGANAGLVAVAEQLGAAGVGFASGPPWVGEVVERLRVQRGGTVGVASYALAPGTLPDRLVASGADLVTEPLGAAPELVELVLQRFDAAASAGAAGAVTPSSLVRGKTA
jgi:sirohydrochlorin ferrochelatase